MSHRSGPLLLRVSPARLLAACLPLLLAACAVGPDYVRPAAVAEPALAQWKQAGDWRPANSAVPEAPGPWWSVFQDASLNEWLPQVAQHNQNVAAAVAAYSQAQALAGQARAALYPSVNLSASGSRNSSTSSTTTGTTGLATVTREGTNFQAGVSASWEADVWGRLRRAVEGSSAGAQASQADLAAATLSAQGEFALNYFSLRAADAQLALLADTIAAYSRSLQITRNRFEAGVAPHSDLLQAQTQLANAQADRLTLQRQRGTLEHAMAILLGRAPSQFSVPVQAWSLTPPAVPLMLPSALLQRRPDVAAAERRVAQANAQIGVAQAAWFPSFGLSASASAGATRLADIVSAPTSVWALGLSAGQVVFNAGLTAARVDAARAAWEQASAQYRQVALTALRSVEDQLLGQRILTDVLEQRRIAADSATRSRDQFQNRYQAGLVAYTEVTTAQIAALNAQRALLQTEADRISASVSLVQALGGGWGGLKN